MATSARWVSTMTAVLKDDTLYLGDNGRAFCGRLDCAGTMAHFTGRDLSGQVALPIPAREARDHGVRCEGCGMQPTLVRLT